MMETDPRVKQHKITNRRHKIIMKTRLNIIKTHGWKKTAPAFVCYLQDSILTKG